MKCIVILLGIDTYIEVRGEKMKDKNVLHTFLPKEVCNFMERLELSEVQEIRMNIGQPLMMKVQGKEVILHKEGGIAEKYQEGFLITEDMLKETFAFICKHSVYAYEEEIRQGFITMEGGHRIGLVGQAVVEQGKVKNIKYVSGLNIRLASEQIGCGEKVIDLIADNDNIFNTLIVAPPCAGKTTLLRDCIRLLSNGRKGVDGVRVGVADERGELGACYRGIPQNDLGIRTDVLDRIPKPVGILMLIRSMAPRVIAVDEIGSKEDMEALKNACLSGCSILATIHGASPLDICEKTVFEHLKKGNMFQRYIVLHQNRIGKIKGIYDENMKLIN